MDISLQPVRISLIRMTRIKDVCINILEHMPAARQPGLLQIRIKVRFHATAIALLCLANSKPLPPSCFGEVAV